MTEHSSQAAACLQQAASYLAACSRPALSLGAECTPEQLSGALNDLVSAAELFGCKPSFWRCTAEAAALLDRSDDAQAYRQRLLASHQDA